MPSFKERFRASRKYKKNKDGTTDESNSAPTTTSTIDEHTGSAALATYSHHHHQPVDPGEWTFPRRVVERSLTLDWNVRRQREVLVS